MSDYGDAQEIDRLSKLVRELTEACGRHRVEAERLERALAIIHAAGHTCPTDRYCAACMAGAALAGRPVQPALPLSESIGGGPHNDGSTEKSKPAEPAGGG